MKNRIILTICLILFGLGILPAPTRAGGLEPFLGETALFSMSFCPKGWTLANGQTMPINQNQALFALIGTTYGGNGITTFNLPNLQGRAPVGAGQGSGLSLINWGDLGGSESVTLTANQIPVHNHLLMGSNNFANQLSPGGNLFAHPSRVFSYSSIGDVYMANDVVGYTGAIHPQPIGIRSPYLGMTWCIALQGIFPSQN